MIVWGRSGDLTYTDKHGMNAGARTPICQIPLKGWRACRHHMRYTRGFKLKGDQRDGLSELQVDRIALQRDIPKHKIEEKDDSEELKENSRGQLGKLEDRWETDRLEGETDFAKRPLLEYEEWRAIEA